MAFSKIIVNNRIIMDLTENNVSSEDLEEGIVTHDSAGLSIIGTMSTGNLIENSILQRNIEGSYENDRVTTVGIGALEQSMALTSVSFPKAEYLGDKALGLCYALTSASVASVTQANDYVFSKCITLSNLSLPSLITDKDSTFRNCKSLTKIYFPNSEMKNYAGNRFQGCTNLVTAVLPKANILFNSCFQDDSSLVAVDFMGRAGDAQALNANTFTSCTALSTLIIRSTGVVPLRYMSAFDNTAFASNSTGGTAYVSSSLISSYETATNWSTLYEAGTISFLALDSSQYKNYYVDGEPVIGTTPQWEVGDIDDSTGEYIPASDGNTIRYILLQRRPTSYSEDYVLRNDSGYGGRLYKYNEDGSFIGWNSFPKGTIVNLVVHQGTKFSVKLYGTNFRGYGDLVYLSK